MSFHYESLPKQYKLYNTKKHQTRIFVLDLETDGYGKFHPRPTQTPTQISWMVLSHDGKKILERDYIVKGAKSIKPGLQNSLSIEKIEKEGVPIGDVLEEFYSLLTPMDIIVCHNALFDVGLIMRFKSPPFPLQNVICTMKDTVDYCKIPHINGRGYKWPKLLELAKTLNISFEDDKFHDSLYDCEILQRCFFVLMKQKVFRMENVLE